SALERRGNHRFEIASGDAIRPGAASARYCVCNRAHEIVPPTGPAPSRLAWRVLRTARLYFEAEPGPLDGGVLAIWFHQDRAMGQSIFRASFRAARSKLHYRATS